jgi:hypothetical protein
MDIAPPQLASLHGFVDAVSAVSSLDEPDVVEDAEQTMAGRLIAAHGLPEDDHHESEGHEGEP